ncbi:tetratricopeptide repeat protein [Actinokineospora sp. HUAS TT18]|uniref:tetratricopeptide repeat protein n=1 Tax=Actinokineospora sp. HUAS TT18 TaxID=3447451 RepID=UPI003F523F63
MAEPIDAVLAQAAELTAAGRPEVAIDILRPVIADHPDHPEAWCRLAAALLDSGRPQDCLDAAKRAITLGEPSWAHRLASLALTELGRHDQAAVSAKEAARRDPGDWRNHVTLAEALGPTSPPDALEAARRAVIAAPDEPRVHEVLGAAAARVRDFPLAKRAYSDALRLDPANDSVRAKLAKLAGVRATPPARPAPGEVRFGRAQRIALWLVLRRCAGWLAAGSFVLMIAGLPRPTPLLVWFALALLLAELVMAAHGVLTLPRGYWPPPRLLARRAPLVAFGAVLFGLGTLLLAVWTLALALGVRGMQLLTPALICAVGASIVGWYGLWRMRAFTR